MKRYHIELTGRVQSCGFRDYCWKSAKKAKVTGWVQNVKYEDHHVILEVQGNDEAVSMFIKRIHQGNGQSRIDTMNMEEIALKEETGFKTKYQ